VTLYDIDDLQGVVERGRAVQAAELGRAERVIEEEIQRFAGWLGSLEVLHTIAALRERGDRIVDGVLSENAGRWDSLSERDRQRVEAVARAVANRLLHEPTVRLKRTARERVHARMQVLRELFGLEEPPAEHAAEPEQDADVRELRPPSQ